MSPVVLVARPRWRLISCVWCLTPLPPVLGSGWFVTVFRHLPQNIATEIKTHRKGDPMCVYYEMSWLSIACYGVWHRALMNYINEDRYWDRLMWSTRWHVLYIVGNYEWRVGLTINVLLQFTKYGRWNCGCATSDFETQRNCMPTVLAKVNVRTSGREQQQLVITGSLMHFIHFARTYRHENCYSPCIWNPTVIDDKFQIVKYKIL